MYIILEIDKQNNLIMDEHESFIINLYKATIIKYNKTTIENKLNKLKNELIYIDTMNLKKIIFIKKIAEKNNNIIFKGDVEIIDFFNNKYKSYNFLQKNGFYQQKTYKLIENKLNYPYILKEINGCQGTEVWKIENKNELNKILEKYNKDFLITQEFNNINIGEDIRVIIFKNSIYFYGRKGIKGDFKSNISVGGNRIKLKGLNSNYKNLIEKLKNDLYLKFPKLENDYFAIDIFKDNKFNIIEMNYNPSLTSFKNNEKFKKDLLNCF